MCDFNNINFELIVGNDQQIKKLYQLLKERLYSISHKELPEFRKHKKFVLNSPYRFWYLIQSSDGVFGAFYIKFDNSVGLNLKFNDQLLLEKVIEFIRSELSPMPAKDSVTPDYFYINVSSKNVDLLDLFDEIGICRLQVSFKVEESVS